MPGKRELNHNWKGGRTISSHGYIKILAGKEHHLADINGYVYEHRIVAEQILGRKLLKGEVIHHIDGNTQNNDPLNISIKTSKGRHFYDHRSSKSNLQKPGENNSIIMCLCGCGATLLKYDKIGRPRRYLGNHNLKIKGKDGRCKKI